VCVIEALKPPNGVFLEGLFFTGTCNK
jgi:hypothetical protein